MVKIAIDAGHGMHTPGKRTPDGEREWSFNNKVAVAAINKLETYENVQVLRLDDPTGKRDVPLKERTDKANAWGADVLVSCHHNAHIGVWGSHGGVETYTQPGSQQASVEIAKIIQPRITKAMGLRDRGCKVANLHMTRESRMPAILTEGGFMDSTTDIETLRNEERLKAQGVAIADGLAAYFNLTGDVVQVSKPKPTAPTPSKPSVSKPSTNKKYTSIVDYLNANKINSSFNNRAKLAIQHSIKNYRGTAAQNTQLLNKLQSGSAPSKPIKVGDQKTNSVVDYLKSIKKDASFANRKKLAAQYGIKNYTGTAAQNAQLLKKLRG